MPASTAFRSLSIPPAELFQENLTHYTERENYFAGRHRLVALVRLLVFVGPPRACGRCLAKAR
ncbi:hypothetical protein MUN84_07635 [Hymenobacter sp. 5516J-16]|uniref:hypothetical protein n=1 Tax=Hymenobacter sp. 5516J-16 TaxID=2932253 RepID=UPI001FD32742|nr:hypothetical protein [Hymenobacter sp. 5516J-16]UOQ78432.1 hypothetical protein MUN84_07635 [Hymenobacter sp. 5516J-16]